MLDRERYNIEYDVADRYNLEVPKRAQFYHIHARLKDGREALLVDPGAHLYARQSHLSPAGPLLFGAFLPGGLAEAPNQAGFCVSQNFKEIGFRQIFLKNQNLYHKCTAYSI